MPWRPPTATHLPYTTLFRSRRGPGEDVGIPRRDDPITRAGGHTGRPRSQGETFGPREGDDERRSTRGRPREAGGRPERHRIIAREEGTRGDQVRAGSREASGRGRPEARGSRAFGRTRCHGTAETRGGKAGTRAGDRRSGQAREGTRIASRLAHEARGRRRGHQVEGDEPPQVRGEDRGGERPRAERPDGGTAGVDGVAAKGDAEGRQGPRGTRGPRTSV